MKKAAQGGHAEIAAGKLGATQGSHVGVKKFSEHLVQDHTKANHELAQIAQKKGLEVPNAPDDAHKRALEKRKKLSGAQFDRRFAATVGVKDHEAAVKLFEAQAKNGRDPELKAFAEKTLPTLKNI